MKPQQVPRYRGRGPRPWTFGNGEMKGLGIIKCAACGEPLSKHDIIGPCPTLGGRAVRLTSPKRQRAADVEVVDETYRKKKRGEKK